MAIATRPFLFLSILIAIIAALAIDTRPSFAGGMFLYELGTPDVGTASAGYAARAQDASTVFTNPAGMTMLEGSQMLTGLQPNYGRLQFQPNSATQTGGTNGGNAAVPLPGGSFFYVYSVNSRLKLGFGSFGYFGGAMEYNLNWVGRYALQGATILGMSFMPAAAYRINDWLSIGAGLNVMLGFMRQKVGVKNFETGGDGQLKYENYTVGFGGDIGVLLQPDEKTRIGLTYLTPVDLNFNDAPHFRGIGTNLKQVLKHSSIGLGMTVPQEVMLSAFRQLTDRLALMGNVNWQDWSQFGLLGISANSTSLTQDLKYQDTFGVAAGLQYKLTSRWLASAGFAWDSSMVTDSNRTVSAPVSSQYRYGAGIQYQLSERTKLGFADEFMWQGDMPLTQGSGPLQVSGQFTNTFVNFFSLNIVHTF